MHNSGQLPIPYGVQTISSNLCRCSRCIQEQDDESNIHSQPNMDLHSLEHLHSLYALKCTEIQLNPYHQILYFSTALLTMER